MTRTPDLLRRQVATLSLDPYRVRHAWKDWTPTLTNLSKGSTGTVVARYAELAGNVFFDIHVTLGGTGISVGDPTFSVPVTESTEYSSGSDDRVTVGQATLIDAATTIYMGVVTIDDGILRPRAYTVAGSLIAQTNIGSTTPHTWAAGDRMWLHGWYEALKE